jgi:hypothetical protein
LRVEIKNFIDHHYGLAVPYKWVEARILTPRRCLRGCKEVLQTLGYGITPTLFPKKSDNILPEVFTNGLSCFQQDFIFCHNVTHSRIIYTVNQLPFLVTQQQGNYCYRWRQ